MSSFKLPSFSFSGSKDDAGKNDEHDDGDGDRGERKSRSLFSSLTGGGSSSHKSGSSSSLRSPSPYAGRSKYSSSSKDSNKSSSGRHHHRPWKRHSRKESQSDVEYAGATSSANVSEAESDGEGVLSRLASNSSSGTTSSSKSNSNTLAPLTSSTSTTSNPSSVSFADTTAPSSSSSSSPARSGNNRSTRFSASSSGPQGGRGAPRNAYYDDEDDDSDADEDEEHRRATAGGGTSDKSTALASSSDRSASSAPSPPVRIRGIRTVDPTTSDSENEEASHEEYAHTSGTDEEDDYYSNDDDDLDPTVAANTEANAGSLTAAELLSSKPALLAGYGDDDPDAYYYNDEEEGPQENWPNLVKSPASPFAPLSSTRSAPGGVGGGVAANRNISSTLSSGANTPPGTTRNGRGRGGTIKSEIPLIASRPIYERNRCSITLTHGDPDSYVQVPGNVSLLESGRSLPVSTNSDSSNNNAQDRSNLTAQGTRKKRKGKTYVVASDLSEESYYAIEWAIGTVLRSGDELLFVTVMETDSKLDPEDGHSHDKTLKIRSQQERQTRTMQLSREATALLERTRLHVRVKCQAIHAKNARHMLIDLIDYFAPTLVIIGSRGLSRLKGIILGSVSHYLIQKSSAPVMVTRRRLKPLRRPPRPISDLQRQPRVGGLANATIDVESHAGMVHQSHAASDGEDTDADSRRLHRDADTGGETEPEQESSGKPRA